LSVAPSCQDRGDESLTGVDVVPEFRLGRWSIDAAVPSKKIAVELDGEYWHSLPAMVDRDRRKDAWLKERGWTVIRIVMSRGDDPPTLAHKVLEAVSPCL